MSGTTPQLPGTDPEAETEVFRQERSPRRSKPTFYTCRGCGRRLVSSSRHRPKFCQRCREPAVGPELDAAACKAVGIEPPSRRGADRSCVNCKCWRDRDPEEADIGFCSLLKKEVDCTWLCEEWRGLPRAPRFPPVSTDPAAGARMVEAFETKPENYGLFVVVMPGNPEGSLWRAQIQRRLEMGSQEVGNVSDGATRCEALARAVLAHDPPTMKVPAQGKEAQ